jgi:hypothetical protein
MNSRTLSQGQNGKDVVLYIQTQLDKNEWSCNLPLWRVWYVLSRPLLFYLKYSQGLHNRDTISLISTVIGNVTWTSVWSPSSWMAQESAEDVVSWPCNKYEYPLLVKFIEMFWFLMLYYELRTVKR